MNNVTETEQVLQKAYNIDLGTLEGSIDPKEVISQIGIMSLHACYYDGGLAQQEEIRRHLREFPNGQFARLIHGLRDARMGEYSAKTLNAMYGLE